MVIEESGTIWDSPAVAGLGRIASFVELRRSKNGVLHSVFQVGTTKNAIDSTLVHCRSEDGGRTWESRNHRFNSVYDGHPGSFSAGSMVDVDGGLLLIATWFDRSDPDRPFFDPETEGILPSKQLAAFSSDEGLTWSDWRLVDVTPLKGCSNTGPLLQWKDGTIAYAFESLKEYNDPATAIPGAWCMISTDEGKTFTAPGLLARDTNNRVYYWDQRLCVGRKSGAFIGMYWTHDRGNARDLSVHMSTGTLLDGERKVSIPVPTGIQGQIAAPLRMENGNLLVFVVQRLEQGRMTLYLSKDDGLTWGQELIVYTAVEPGAVVQKAADIDYAEYWSDMTKWSFGHPSIVAIDDKSVLVAYYAGGVEVTKIKWARVAV